MRAKRRIVARKGILARRILAFPRKLIMRAMRANILALKGCGVHGITAGRIGSGARKSPDVCTPKRRPMNDYPQLPRRPLDGPPRISGLMGPFSQVCYWMLQQVRQLVGQPINRLASLVVGSARSFPLAILLGQGFIRRHRHRIAFPRNCRQIAMNGESQPIDLAHIIAPTGQQQPAGLVVLVPCQAPIRTRQTRESARANGQIIRICPTGLPFVRDHQHGHAVLLCQPRHGCEHRSYFVVAVGVGIPAKE